MSKFVSEVKVRETCSPLAMGSLLAVHRTIEYSKLEGIHKDHPVQLLVIKSSSWKLNSWRSCKIPTGDYGMRNMVFRTSLLFTYIS